MHVDLSDDGFRNLVQLQIYLKEESGKDFSTEDVFELLLQNAINHVQQKKETDIGGFEEEGKTDSGETN